MNTDKKLLIGALVVGFIAGFFVSSMGSNRYQLKDSGLLGVVYKVDTRTGQTWFITPEGERPLK
jgi:hypothetical protein